MTCFDDVSLETPCDTRPIMSFMFRRYLCGLLFQLRIFYIIKVLVQPKMIHPLSSKEFLISRYLKRERDKERYRDIKRDINREKERERKKKVRDRKTKRKRE